MAREEIKPHHLEALATAAQGGDRAALEALIAALYPIIAKHLGFILDFDATLEDAVQESMIGVHRALPSFRGDSNVSTWALAIATRTGRRVRRSERRKHREGLPRSEAVDPQQPRAAEAFYLSKALAKLSPKKREAFVLIAILELTAAEAGQALGVSANTAASRYRHARAELEKIYTRGEKL